MKKPPKTLVLVLLFYCVMGVATFAVLNRRTRNDRILWVLSNIATASHAYYEEHSQWPICLQSLTSNPYGTSFLTEDITTSDAWDLGMRYLPYQESRGWGAVQSTVLAREFRFGLNDLHELRVTSQ